MFHPENSAKRAREVDAFDGCKGDETFSEGCVAGVAPFKCPVGLLLDAGDSLETMKKFGLLVCVLDVGVKEQGVHLCMDIFNEDLKTIETLGFQRLDFLSKVREEVFIYDAVCTCKKSQDVGEKVSFWLRQLVPVAGILGNNAACWWHL